MREERQDRQRGHIGRGALFSALLHGSAILPLVAMAVILGRQEAAERASEVGVEFQEVSEAELPDDLPAIDDGPAEAEPSPPPRRTPAKDRPVAERPPAPEPPPPLPPEEQKPPPPPPPQPEERKQNQKMVDLDTGKDDEEPPPDAKYLAQKNNRTEEETRATDTNLERNQEGTPGSSPSDRQDERPGDAEDKVADLEDQKSRLGREAPRVTPQEDPDLADKNAGPKKSLLSLRDAPRRPHTVTPETVDPSLPRGPEGALAVPEEGLRATRDLDGTPGKARANRLRLSGEQYRYLFGNDADAAAALAQKERSQRGGKYAERLGRLKSALENFIPEVKPGNQTVLNTRAAPFAAFIARMHRDIHRLWGFGFLVDLDRKPESHPYNDRSLVTKLELVLNADGTIHRVGVIRSSSYTPFDAAAVDVAYTAAPFANPPREIRSGNGKIYIHWSFHRDDRQCSTAGVEYFILDNAPPEADRPERGIATSGIPTPTRSGGSSARGAGRSEGAEERAVSEGPVGPAPAKGPAPRANGPRPNDPRARATAEHWFDAFARGDLGRIAAQTAFPFRSSSGIAAQSARELGSLLAATLEEAGGARPPRALQVYSAAGVRGALGTVPPGFEDATRSLFAVAHVAGDMFVLVLEPRGEAWKAVGLIRR